MQRLKWPVSLLLAALLLYLLARQVSVDEMVGAWRNLSAAALVLGLVVLTMDYALRCLRWRMMLGALGSPVSTRACAGPMLAGFALNNILPLRAGDIARAFSFTSVLHLPADRISGTLIIERLLDLFTLCMFFLLGAGLTPLATGHNAFAPVILTATATIAAVFLTLLWAPTASKRLVEQLLERLFPRRPGFDRVRLFIQRVFESLIILGRHGTLLRLAAISAVVWLLEAGVFYLILRDLDGPGGFVASLFSMAMGTIGTLLPSTPGYVGTFDYFAAAGMQAYGAGPATAITAALAIHLLLWLPITLAGLAYLARRWRGTFSDHLRAVREEAANE